VQLLMIRHAIAQDREVFAASGQDDRLRPLTARGRRRMRQGARGLRALVGELDLIATSPLTRAVQTARLLARAFGGPEPVELPALEPLQDPDPLLTWLGERDADATVALVGHEPGMSEALAWLLAQRRRSFVALGKGGAALVQLRAPIAAGSGVLCWALRPGQLRRLAR
jgi:phosphohistidine phosphatase